MLGKQKWRICSSQPTPKEAKLLSIEPYSLFVEPKEKNILIHHLLHYTNVNPPSNCSLLLLTYILLNDVFPRTWSFMSLLLFNNSTRSANLIFGDDASCISSSHSMVSATCHFPLVGQRTLFQQLFPLVFSFSNFY